MKIYQDNIIYFLQNFGGISVYWNELSKRIKLKPNIELKFIELINYPNKFKERVAVDKTNIINDMVELKVILSENQKLLQKIIINNQSARNYSE